MQVVTASITLDFQRYWLGVLAMDFSVQEMKTFLVNAIKTGEEGECRFNLSMQHPFQLSLSVF
jgi:hypothetical protein